MYLLLLLTVFLMDVELDGLRDLLPPSLGPLPTAVPWFGATGAVLGGLPAHFFHSRDWDASYNRWHASRPFLGAVEGPVGCLLLLVTVRAATKQTPASDPAFYDAAAFLVGFADENFRALIDKATRVIIGPGDTGSGSKQP